MLRKKIVLAMSVLIVYLFFPPLSSAQEINFSQALKMQDYTSNNLENPDFFFFDDYYYLMYEIDSFWNGRDIYVIDKFNTDFDLIQRFYLNNTFNVSYCGQNQAYNFYPFHCDMELDYVEDDIQVEDNIQVACNMYFRGELNSSKNGYVISTHVLNISDDIERIVESWGTPVCSGGQTYGKPSVSNFGFGGDSDIDEWESWTAWNHPTNKDEIYRSNSNSTTLTLLYTNPDILEIFDFITWQDTSRLETSSVYLIYTANTSSISYGYGRDLFVNVYDKCQLDVNDTCLLNYIYEDRIPLVTDDDVYDFTMYYNGNEGLYYILYKTTPSSNYASNYKMAIFDTDWDEVDSYTLSSSPHSYENIPTMGGFPSFGWANYTIPQGHTKLYGYFCTGGSTSILRLDIKSYDNASLTENCRSGASGVGCAWTNYNGDYCDVSDMSGHKVNISHFGGNPYTGGHVAFFGEYIDPFLWLSRNETWWVFLAGKEDGYNRDIFYQPEFQTCECSPYVSECVGGGSSYRRYTRVCVDDCDVEEYYEYDPTCLTECDDQWLCYDDDYLCFWDGDTCDWDLGNCVFCTYGCNSTGTDSCNSAPPTEPNVCAEGCPSYQLQRPYPDCSCYCENTCVSYLPDSCDCEPLEINTTGWSEDPVLMFSDLALGLSSIIGYIALPLLVLTLGIAVASIIVVIGKKAGGAI